MNSPFDERHIRLDDFESRVASVEFSPEIWAVLAQLGQPATANQVALLVNQSPDEVLKAFALLVPVRLIRKEVIGWAQFVARPVAKPVVVVRCPAPKALIENGAGPLVSVRLGTVPSDRPLVNVRLGGPLQRGDKTAVSGWRLKPVLDAIAGSVGGGIPGQLLLCKVFLQVPPGLLKSSGIASATSVDAEARITDPLLRAAIISAARIHAKVDVAALAA